MRALRVGPRAGRVAAEIHVRGWRSPVGRKLLCVSASVLLASGSLLTGMATPSARAAGLSRHKSLESPRGGTIGVLTEGTGASLGPDAYLELSYLKRAQV